MRNKLISTAIMVLLFGGVAGVAQADPPETTTDSFSAERPGFTNGTETIPPKHFQWEAGLTYSRQQGTTGRLLDDGAQVRYGLTPRSEVRLGLPNYGLFSADGQKTSGWNSASISGKMRFLDETKRLPSVAVIAGTTLPTGSPDTSEHFFQPSLDLEVSRSLTERYTLQTNLLYVNARDNGTRFNQFAGALNLGAQLTPEVSGFIEVYRVAPTGAEGASNGDYFDGGFTLVRQNRWQFDINAGVGLLKEVRHDYFVTTGISRRW